jgi:UDP-N-acetylmuramate dehydrogenase
MISIEEIRQYIKGEILIGVPMSEHTSFKIGGVADFVIKPVDKDDAIATIRYFQASKKPYRVLGKGSNVLVSDEGLREPVVFLDNALSNFEIHGHELYVEAGADLAKVSVESFKARLSGIEMLAGIPGTVGGALLMNAGAHGQEIYDNLSWVEIMVQGELKRIKKKELKVGYRQSQFKDEIVIAAQFSLRKLTSAEYETQLAVRTENLQKRRLSQPLSQPNAGCIFKNVLVNGQTQSAGKLIDESGLKGLRYGGAKVSEKHANFIVNTGQASADDVLSLIELVRQKVKEKTGQNLELEIKLLGFKPFKIQNLTG